MAGAIDGRVRAEAHASASSASAANSGGKARPGSAPAGAVRPGCDPGSELGCDLEEQALLRMRKARSELVLAQPFFGSLLLRLELKADPACRDVWTDGRTLGFNPVYAASQEEGHLASAQAHEALHIALKHNLRRRGRDGKLWNRACDVAVNHLLREAGFALPSAWPVEEEYAGMSVDAVYEEMKRLQEGRPRGGARDAKAKGAAQESSGSLGLGGREGASAPAGERPEAKSGEAGEEDAGGRSRAVPQKASADAEGGSRQAEAPRFAGEVRDHPLLMEKASQDARRRAEREADIAISLSLQSAPGAAGLAQSVRRAVEGGVRPKVDWREALRRFIEDCADADYAWTMPNRRYLWQDLYLPSRHEQTIAGIALAVDCSGSIDAGELAVFCEELSGILDHFDTELWVVYHDAAATGHERFTRADRPLKLAPKGGGGTDYRPVPPELARLGVRPACLVWFTDFECDAFPEEPDYPVLWCATREPAVSPPFGEIVLIST